MARYDSTSTETQGQYPATAWPGFGLPVQDESSGAPGSPAPSDALDSPDPGTNQPGQYPERDSFTGAVFSQGGAAGTGAPGSAGVGEPDLNGVGPDTVQWSVDPIQNKSMYDEGGMESGMRQHSAGMSISGPDDWTQANSGSYGGDDSLFLPPLHGNMPHAGEGPYQPGEGKVLHGGFMKGQR